MYALRRTAALSAFTLFAVAARLHAQGTLREQTASLNGATPRAVIAINPFLPLFGKFQGEVEVRARDNLAVALSGSHIRLDDDYTSADVKLRLYPSGRALQGFGIAMGVGVGRINDPGGEYSCPLDDPVGSPCRPPRSDRTGPTFSVEMHHQWLLGTSQSTAMTLGGGLKRYFVDNPPSSFDVFNRLVPTLRLTIGYAFR